MIFFIVLAAEIFFDLGFSAFIVVSIVPPFASCLPRGMRAVNRENRNGKMKTRSRLDAHLRALVGYLLTGLATVGVRSDVRALPRRRAVGVGVACMAAVLSAVRHQAGAVNRVGRAR